MNTDADGGDVELAEEVDEVEVDVDEIEEEEGDEADEEERGEPILIITENAGLDRS